MWKDNLLQWNAKDFGGVDSKSQSGQDIQTGHTSLQHVSLKLNENGNVKNVTRKLKPEVV